jgi:hypothetical protein
MKKPAASRQIACARSSSASSGSSPARAMATTSMRAWAAPTTASCRASSICFYLRDIAEGGETEFPFQLRHVKPKAGLLLLFPPFWTHLHRGVSPVSAVKYNITNFVILRPQP